ncbi:MAG: BirA family transcriptional regulator [Bacteroidales bacterium]|nr:BirA family transcriptional regulator [Bacteroidales bacterium]
MKQEVFQAFSLNFLKSVDSTNRWLQDRINKLKTIANQVVCTEYQSGGRGMDGNQWHSERGQNLLFSLGMDASFILASEQFLITQMIALAIVDELSDHIDHRKISIKWPNDIFFEEKKLGGILISNTIRASRLDQSVIGVGLNINQMNFPEWIPRPVSMGLICNQKFDSLDILKGILKRFSLRMDQAKNSDGLLRIAQDYHQKLFRLDQWYVYKLDNSQIELKIKGIGEYGMLKLENRAGKNIDCDFKAIRFLFDDELL